MEVFSGCSGFGLPIGVVAHTSVLLGLLLGSAMAVPAAQPAQAAPPPGVPPISARTTGVVTADGLPTAQINGVVWTQAVAGDRVFAGW